MTVAALIRPARVSRIAAAVGALVLGFCILGLTATLTGFSTLLAPSLLALPCGFIWNAVRNQGAWLGEHAVVLEAVVGRAVIPLDEIHVVHIDEEMTTLGVKTSKYYVVQSIVAPAKFNVRAGARERTVRLLRGQNIPCLWHDSLAEVYGVAATTSPFMWPGAVLGTLRRPLVWGSALVGLGYGLLLLWTGGA